MTSHCYSKIIPLYTDQILLMMYQMKFMDSLLKKHELEVLSLEEEKVRLARVGRTCTP